MRLLFIQLPRQPQACPVNEAGERRAEKGSGGQKGLS